MGQQENKKTKQVTTAEYLNQIQEALMKQIAEKVGAMPEGFNKDRFILNCITLSRDMLKDKKKCDKRSFSGIGFSERRMLRNPLWRGNEFPD